MSLVFKHVESPVGRLRLVASETGLVAVGWERNEQPSPKGEALVAGGHPLLEQAEGELSEYFAGRRIRFSVPLDMRGTPFQKQVWDALLRIPFGETRSYGELARQLGVPNAMRAVGAANGRNPVAIIAPCHRVVGANGKLTGFAGGLEAKAFLLRLESRHAALFE